MTIPRILAIDPSLTSLGYAHNVAAEGYETGTLATKAKGLDRLSYLAKAVESLLEETQPELIAYEGYAMGKFVGKIFDRAELGGVLKYMMFRRNIPILLVPPTNLKLFATGKGNADKDQVKIAMAKVAGKRFKTDDEADAFALLQMGLAYRVRRLRPRDPRHYSHTALRGCELIS